jgi:tetratricopeptide (TPR) repeat protein
MSGQIFISYRREESRWSARSVYDRLTAHFEREQIFMDVDAVAPGDDFVKAIEKRVGECEVLIAVIGSHWLTSTDEQAGRRLDNPEDFLRMEIATALRRDIRVIPVLVDGALMPRSTDLPDDLKALVRRNAMRVSHTEFDDDCRRLVAAIELVFEKNLAEKRQRQQKQQLETERLESERLKTERLKIEQREKERIDAERLEKPHTASARLRAEEIRREAERKAQELRVLGAIQPAETVYLEATRQENEPRETERLDAERREKDRLEAELRDRLEVRRRVREERERSEAQQSNKEQPQPCRTKAAGSKHRFLRRFATLAIVLAALTTFFLFWGSRVNNPKPKYGGISYYTEAIHADPKNASNYQERGFVYYYSGDYDKAISDFTELIRLDPKSAMNYVFRANAYNANQDYDKAISDYTEAIRLDPKRAGNYNNRGNAYYNKLDYDKAISDYTEAIRLDPKIPVAYGNRGKTYYRKLDYDKAISDYTEAIRLDPKDADYYEDRGNAHSRKKEYDEAKADLSKADELKKAGHQPAK